MHAQLVAAAGDGTLLGTVTWCPPGSPWRELSRDAHQAEFRMLAVAPAGRRRGLARALVEACLDRARRDAMTEVVIWSHPRMLGAHDLYARMGFERAPDLDGSPVPGVVITADRSPSTRREALEHGCEVLLKPVRPAALRAALGQASRRKRSIALAGETS